MGRFFVLQYQFAFLSGARIIATGYRPLGGNVRIIVIGDGKIGHHIAAQLVSEGHEVTIIDRDESV